MECHSKAWKGLMRKEVWFMKRFLIVLSVLLFAVTLTAQVRTGNIYGKVVDTEGNPLPGVSVTLTGSQICLLYTSDAADE